jgi:hypothetical protein
MDYALEKSSGFRSSLPGHVKVFDLRLSVTGDTFSQRHVPTRPLRTCK